MWLDAVRNVWKELQPNHIESTVCNCKFCQIWNRVNNWLNQYVLIDYFTSSRLCDSFSLKSIKMIVTSDDPNAMIACQELWSRKYRTQRVSRYVHLRIKDCYDRSPSCLLRVLSFPRSRDIPPARRGLRDESTTLFARLFDCKTTKDHLFLVN